ncbi:MAG: hypothetical protein ABIQ31_14905 [Ferruginibacter sp.]
MKIKILLFCLLIACSSGLGAQTVDSMMSLYADSFQQEKIHIHFDKNIYNKGETIWFKAYLMAGTELSYYSKNFYVDWFDNQGKLLSHTVSPIFESTAKGQFLVPEKYAGELIHAKAYTNWMLNFDTAFLYNKDLQVYQPLQAGEQVAREKPVASIQFFPESGDMVDGIVQRMAFLANNQFGVPVSAMGTIKNSKGESILSFSTTHDGMGSFLLQADAADSYAATWTDEYGASHTTSLPGIRKSAATMQVQQSKGKIVFTVTRSADAENFKTLNVIAHMNQYELFRSHINLVSKTAGFGTIPTADLPTGVLQITLFDIFWVPIAERIVFVNNNQYGFEPSVNVVEKNLAARGKNKIDIELTDSILSNMSVAITDADLLSDNSNNIISQLLLAGDIKNYIHNPAYYLSSDADSVRQHLDLVMLTHGWRRFNWEAIAKEALPVFTRARDTDFLQIKGAIYGLAKNKAAKADQSINLVLQAKDSSTQLLFLPISPEGTFLQKDIMYYDTLKIFYTLNGDKKSTSKVDIHFDNGLAKAPSNIYGAVARSPLLLKFETVDSLSSNRNKFFYTEKLKLDKLSAIALLEEVKLKSKAPRPVDLLDTKYSRGLFAGGDSRQFDVANDPFAIGAGTVFRYLQGKVAGLSIVDAGDRTRLSWRGGTPDVFLNEVRADVEVMRGVAMSDVAYIKVFRPPFMGSFGGGSGGAIAVYTRKGSDVKFAPGEGLNFQSLAGYDSYKEFYSPNYTQLPDAKPDARTTLYWNPFILIDKETNVYHIEFFNNDVSKKLRVILEGINSNGKLARIEKVIE